MRISIQNDGLTIQSSQKGAVLILSMVILLIMTLIGTANMQSAGLQQKMAANAKARQEAFQFAESALRFVETSMQNRWSGPASGRQLILNCMPGDATCFEPTCSGGLCFTGTLDPSGDLSECKLTTHSSLLANTSKAAFLDRDIWLNDARHQKAFGVIGPIQDYVSQPKFIVEFMCFVKADQTQDCKPGSAGSCSPLFRATALVERQGVAARVMLSSLFRLQN